jgi:hypothetical protein
MIDYGQDKELFVHHHTLEKFATLGYGEINDESLKENEEIVLNHYLQDAQLFDAPIYDEYYEFDDDLHEQQVVFTSSDNFDQPSYDEDVLTLQDQFSSQPFSVTKSHT